jgi:hypothetical protein
VAVAGQQQQRPRQPLFAGIEQLIDEVRFDPDVALQHVGQEPVGERGLLVEQPDDRAFSIVSTLLGAIADAVAMRID